MLEKTLSGDLHSFLDYFDREISSGLSVTLEDSTECSISGVTCAVRIYERYSWSGGNRVSLNLTVAGDPRAFNGIGQFHVIAATSGGSQAMLFKLNTLGEHSFLEFAEQIIDSYNG